MAVMEGSKIFGAKEVKYLEVCPRSYGSQMFGDVSVDQFLESYPRSQGSKMFGGMSAKKME